jgi:hypothetical protein
MKINSIDLILIKSLLALCASLENRIKTRLVLLIVFCDIAKAAALVGHKSLDTTKRYLRYQNNSEESLKFLDDALGLQKQEQIEKLEFETD